MKTWSFLALLMPFGLLSCNTLPDVRQSDYPDPPRAEKIEKELTIHGDTRVDPYYWLNERDNPKVIQYLEDENAYLQTVMEGSMKFRDQLFDEIISRIRQDDASVPFFDNGYFYYTRFEKGGEYPIYCRKRASLEASEEVMLNVNEMAKGYSYYNIGGWSVSPDNRMLAFGVDTVSRRNYTLYFKNLETGEIMSQSVSETTGSSAWANDSKTIFFTRKNQVTLRSERIFLYVIGEEPSTVREVFFEEDETFGTIVMRTKSGQYLLIASYSTLSTEFRYIPADRPQAIPTVILPRERDHEYAVDHFGDHFYIRTNWDAMNFRIMKTPVGDCARENWTEVIPHRTDVLVEGFEIFRDYLVVEERSKGLTQLRIIDNNNGDEHYLNFGEEAYAATVSVNRDFNSEWLRYDYSSLTTPSSVFDYNMKSRDRKLMKQQEVLGGFSSDQYETRRIYVAASDGAEVPVSIVYRKGLVLNGKNPTLLYGYGSYGASMDPRFSSVRLSLLDRGFVYALAHIRGGQEMGRSWYEDGKLLKKKNTFTDFIDVAESLIELGYTRPDYLFGQGGSAGGLLVGAVSNMRPDLFRGIIANVPFVDVVTTMLDETIPLTTSEYDEWGNPNDPVYYEYMLSYSPYDQVIAGDYPALLVTTGLHDSQVQYFEPAKWVARLRELKTDDNILLMNINMETGHGGASGRFERYRESALEYAFMFKLLGISQ